MSHKKSLTESSLGWASLGSLLKEDNKTFLTPKNRHVQSFIRETVQGRRANYLNRKLVSSSFDKIVNILEQYYGSNLEISALFDKYFDYSEKTFKENKNKVESWLGDCRQINKDTFEFYINKRIGNLHTSRELKPVDECKLLVSSDYNSLYPNGMAHKDSKWPKRERAITIKKKKVFVYVSYSRLVTGGNWTNQVFSM